LQHSFSVPSENREKTPFGWVAHRLSREGMRMIVYYITFRSVTPAQRGESLLRKNGIRCSLRRTPRWMQENGCGYCLKLDVQQIGEAVGLLDRAGVPYRKVYSQNGAGDTEEVTL